MFAGLRGRDVAIFQVLQYLLARAVRRLAPAAAGAGIQAHQIALAQAGLCDLGDALHAAVGAPDLGVVAGAALSALHAPGQELVAAVGAGEKCLFANDAVVQHGAVAAALPARAGIVGVESVLLHAYAVTCLGHFHRYVVGLAIARPKLAAFTVFTRSRAPAAREGLHQYVEFTRVRMLPRDNGAADRCKTTGRNTFGHYRCQRLHDQVHREDAGLPVNRGGGGTLRREQGGVGTHHLEQPEHAAVGRNVGHGGGQEHGADARGHAGTRGVDRPRHLRMAAGEIGNEFLADSDLDLGVERPMPEAVVVNKVVRGVAAVRQLGQRRAHHRLAVVEQPHDGRLHRGRSIFVEQAAQAFLAHLHRRHAGPQVAQRHVGQAHIGRNHVQQRLVQLARAHQLHAGELDAFLVHFRRVGRKAAGRLATDFGPVRLAGDKGHDVAVGKYRFDQRHVRQMGAAAAIRVVGQVDVVGL